MKRLLSLILVLCSLSSTADAQFPKWYSNNHGWDIRKGYDTSAIENPHDMRETDWSKWLVTQAGLDPLRFCESPTRSGKRVDILTVSEAIEVEWSHKWYEAIGQSVFYSIETMREPAIILLSRGDDAKEILHCQAVCAKCGIRLYVQRVPNKFPIPESDTKPETIGFGEVIFAKRLRLKR